MTTITSPERRRPAGPAPAGPRIRRRRILTTVERLAATYPAECELIHENPLQLLVATILSAQSTDARVNLTTPGLFARFPTARALAEADLAELESLIHATGFFRAKSRAIQGCALELIESFGGEVPPRMADLVTLPGVGRKTANVVLGVGFGIPGLPVDTHVIRVSNRLGLVTSTDPVKIETELCAVAPREEWTGLSLRLILHGRRVCQARRPRCSECLLVDFCPSASAGSAP